MHKVEAWYVRALAFAVVAADHDKIQGVAYSGQVVLLKLLHMILLSQHRAKRRI